jgi:hypothetical protein
MFSGDSIVDRPRFGHATSIGIFYVGVICGSALFFVRMIETDWPDVKSGAKMKARSLRGGLGLRPRSSAQFADRERLTEPG